MVLSGSSQLCQSVSERFKQNRTNWQLQLTQRPMRETQMIITFVASPEITVTDGELTGTRV